MVQLITPTQQNRGAIDLRTGLRVVQLGRSTAARTQLGHNVEPDANGVYRLEGERDELSIWIDKKSYRMVEGVATSCAINEFDLALNTLGCEFDLPMPLLHGHGAHLSQGKRVYSSQLQQASVGDVVFLKRTGRSILFRGVFHDSPAGAHAWSLVKSGRHSAASIGWQSLSVGGIVDGITYIDRWRLNEISIVPRGANPDAYCKVYRR